MSPKLVIKAIQTIVLSMTELDERERWQSYATIRTLTDELFRWAEMRGKPPTGLVSEKIVELMSGVEGLARFFNSAIHGVVSTRGSSSDFAA